MQDPDIHQDWMRPMFDILKCCLYLRNATGKNILFCDHSWYSSSSTGLFNRVLTQHNAEVKTDCQKTFWNGHAPGESLHTHRDLKEQEKKINKCCKNISDILLLQVTISFVETKLQSSPNSEKQQTSDSPW